MADEKNKNEIAVDGKNDNVFGRVSVVIREKVSSTTGKPHTTAVVRFVQPPGLQLHVRFVVSRHRTFFRLISPARHRNRPVRTVHAQHPPTRSSWRKNEKRKKNVKTSRHKETTKLRLSQTTVRAFFYLLFSRPVQVGRVPDRCATRSKHGVTHGGIPTQIAICRNVLDDTRRTRIDTPAEPLVRIVFFTGLLIFTRKFLFFFSSEFFFTFTHKFVENQE